MGVFQPERNGVHGAGERVLWWCREGLGGQMATRRPARGLLVSSAGSGSGNPGGVGRSEISRTDHQCMSRGKGEEGVQDDPWNVILAISS